MTADRFPHLLSPLTIGRVTVRNRAFSSAHGTGFAVNGLLSERHIEYHRARARGGIGLIVIEATAIDDAPISAGVSAANLHNTSDAVLPLYRRIADAVRNNPRTRRASMNVIVRNPAGDYQPGQWG